MVGIHFKTFSTLAAASAWVAITAQSAPTGVVRSQVVRHGAVIRGALSVQSSTCHSSPRAAGSAGEWPATTAALAKAGASTQLLSLTAHRLRVFHRLLHLGQRRHRVLCPPFRQVLTLRPPSLRHVDQARESGAIHGNATDCAIFCKWRGISRITGSSSRQRSASKRQ